MTQQFFVNLPVKDVKKSIQFWKHVGYSFNPQMSGDQAACLLLGETFFAMLASYEMFNQISPKPVVDPSKLPPVIVGIACTSKEEVDTRVRLALEAGAKRHGEPEDHGFMYQDAFVDPDGHGWAVTYWNPSFTEK